MSSGTIICAVNETQGAAEALRTAAHLGRRLNMRLVAVHVVEDVPMSPAARREARAGGMRLVDRVLAEEGARTADRRVASGDPAAEIARIAGEERAELVVVGSKPTAARHARRYAAESQRNWRRCRGSRSSSSLPACARRAWQQR